MKWKEILRKDKYALLQSESDTQYAVVSGYDPTQPEDQQWAHDKIGIQEHQQYLSAEHDYQR